MADQLTTLYELSKWLEEVGREPFWPKCLRYEREWYNEDCGPYAVWLYTDDHGFGGYEIEPQHAIAIVKDAAERWLRDSRGITGSMWQQIRWDRYRLLADFMNDSLTLTEAVAYEARRQIKEQS